jgi:predicted transcriptional regulator
MTTVITTEEQPTPPSVEILVGEMKAKLEQLLEQNVSKEQFNQLENRVSEIQNWTYDSLTELIREIANPPMEQAEEIVEVVAEEVAEEVAEQLDEIVEVVEEVDEQIDEIPVVPIQVEQDEPIQASAKKRPWWL